MKHSTLRSAVLLLATAAPLGAAAAADNSVTVQPVTHALGARAGTAMHKPAPAEALPAPVVLETRATRLPDGSLSLECVEAPNPQYAERAARRAQAGTQER